MEYPEDIPVHKSGRLDRSNELFIIQAAFVILAGVCLLIRAYIKCFIIRANLLDDYLLYGSMVGYIAYSAVIIDGSHNGAIGKHPSLDFSAETAARSLRAWYIAMMIYPPMAFAIRASVCVLLFRINTKTVYMWYIWTILIANGIVSVAFFFVLVFQCSPPQYFWTQVYGDSGYCYDRLIVDRVTIVYGVLSALSDWSLGLLPIVILWSVQINLRTKIAIGGLLGLGVIAGIAPVVRIVYLTYLQPGLHFLYEATDIMIWSLMEPALGITASCVATFRPLLRSCGLGWSSQGHLTIHDLPEIPQHEVAHQNNIRAAGTRRVFDCVHNKARLHGSEHELSIC